MEERDYKIQVSVPAHIYRQLKSKLKEFGLESQGHQSTIGEINSRIYVGAVEELLTGNKDIREIL